MPPPLAELRSGAGKRTSPVPMKGGRVEESRAARGREPAKEATAGGASGNSRDQRGHSEAGGGAGEQQRRAESQQQERRRLWLAERHLELDRVRAELRASATGGSSRDDRRRLREEMRRVRSPGAPVGEDTRRRSPGTSPAHEALLVERRESAEVCTPRRERLSLHRVRQLRQRSVGGPAEESPEREEGSVSLPLAADAAKARTRSLEDPARILAKAREDAAMRRMGQQSPIPAGVRLGAKPVADGGESSPRPAPHVVRQLPAGLMPTARKERPAAPEAGASSGGPHRGRSAAEAGATSGPGPTGAAGATTVATAAAVAVAAGTHQAAQATAEDRERIQSAQLLNEAERVIQVLQEQKARLREVFDTPTAASTSVAPSSSSPSPGMVHVQPSIGSVGSAQIRQAARSPDSAVHSVRSPDSGMPVKSEDDDAASSTTNVGLQLSFSSAGSPAKAGSYVSPGGGSSKESSLVLHSASSAAALEQANVGSARDDVDPLSRSMNSRTAPRMVEATAPSGKPGVVPALQLRKRPAQPVSRLESTASGAPGVLYSPNLHQAREAGNNTLLGSFRGNDSTANLRSPRSAAGPSPRSPMVHGGTISAPVTGSRPSHVDMGHSASVATPSSPATQERMVSARGLPGGAPHFWSKGVSPTAAGQSLARGVSPASVVTAGQPMTRGVSPTGVAQPLNRGLSPTSVGPPSRMVSSANASTAEHGGVGVTVSPRLVSTGAPPVASAAARVVRPQAHAPLSVQSQSHAIKATPTVPWTSTITRSPSMIGIEHAGSTQISLA